MPQHGNGVWDWALTAALALWGFVVGHLSLSDWVTVLTLFLVVLKLAHEIVRFRRTLRMLGRDDQP